MASYFTRLHVAREIMLPHSRTSVYSIRFHIRTSAMRTHAHMHNAGENNEIWADITHPEYTVKYRIRSILLGSIRERLSS